MAGLMSLAMVALVGCNKENNAPSADGAEATVSIKLQGAQMRAATYEPGKGEDDMKVYSLAAMVYKGDVQEAIKEVKEDVREITGIECTAGDRKLVVVANYGDLNLKGMTLSELEKQTLKLAKEQQNPQSGLHMMTSDVVGVTIKAGVNVYGKKTDDTKDHEIGDGEPLMITHVHAGMEFAKVTVAFKEPFASKYSVELTKDTKIIGLIVKGQSKIFGKPLYDETAGFLYGEEHKSDAANKYTPDANYELGEGLIKDFINETTKDAGFYILENKSDKNPTILTLKTPLLDKSTGAVVAGDALTQAKNAGYCDDKGFTYYPVLVNWEKKGYTYGADDKNTRNIIERNHKYQITMNITGPGTNEPEKPVDEPATLEVTVKVAPWVLVAQNVEW